MHPFRRNTVSLNMEGIIYRFEKEGPFQMKKDSYVNLCLRTLSTVKDKIE